MNDVILKKNILNKKLLLNKYHKENKSMQNIADEYGCTRTYVWKLLKAANIKAKEKIGQKKMHGTSILNAIC